MERIDTVLVAFDEMGFEPTTLLPDPEKARAEWKASLVAAIKEMDNHIDVLNGKIKYLKEKTEKQSAQIADMWKTKAICETVDYCSDDLVKALAKIDFLEKQNADLKRTNEAIQRATAQDILQQMWEWKDRGTPFIADIQELADRYGAEVKNDD